MLSTELKYSVIFSKRRTVSICVDRDGSILVRAPRFITKKEVSHIVNQKRDWIEKKQQQMAERIRLGNQNTRTYQPDSTMPYLGKEYPLKYEKVSNLSKPVVSFQNESFQIRCEEFDADKIKLAFRTWYFNKSKDIYKDRISYYQAIIQEPFGQVRIKEQKSCYGSCSSRRNLNFNWKCILAPIEVLDYVVIHELCHLKELNHSPRFWAEVEKVMPDYKIQKRWLKEHTLDI